MSKIEKLTEEQVDKLEEYRNKWLKIGLSTGPCDRSAAEKAIDLVYACGGLPPPKIKVWLRSPYAGITGAFLVSKLGDLGDQVRAQVWSQVWDQVVSQVRDQVVSQVRAQVWSQVWSQVWDQVGSQVWDQVGSQVRVKVYKVGYGVHDANWLAFYEFFLDSMRVEGIDKIRGLLDLARSGCGWWWAFEGAVILTEPPTKIVRDEEHRLHCEGGPALLYGDGFGLWSWHGVRVSKDVIENPETITISQILQENNQEIRRVMLEKYGWIKVLRDLKAKTVHQDCYGTLYETDRIKEYLEGEDAVAKYVFVKDPSTNREYALRVPPTIQTAKAAVAWTFGYEDKEAEQYNPEQEA
jgi:hypothetical protein